MSTALPPDALIGRRLAMAAKAVRAFTEHRLAGVGSSLSTSIIIKVLAEDPGLSQRELAQRIDLTGPTLVRHLDRMEADGLITRTRDDADRRVQRLELTTAGRAARRRLSAATNDAHTATAAVFTAAELETFERMLDRLTDHAREMLAEELRS